LRKAETGDVTPAEAGVYIIEKTWIPAACFRRHKFTPAKAGAGMTNVVSATGTFRLSILTNKQIPGVCLLIRFIPRPVEQKSISSTKNRPTLWGRPVLCNGFVNSP